MTLILVLDGIIRRIFGEAISPEILLPIHRSAKRAVAVGRAVEQVVSRVLSATTIPTIAVTWVRRSLRASGMSVIGSPSELNGCLQAAAMLLQRLERAGIRRARRTRQVR